MSTTITNPMRGMRVNPVTNVEGEYHGGLLGGVLGSAQELGLTAAVQTAFLHAEHAAALHQAVETSSLDVQRDAAKLADDLYAGRVKLPDVEARVVSLTARESGGGLYRSVLTRAAGKHEQSGWDVVRAQGERWVTVHVRPLVAAVLDEARTLLPVLDGIDSDSDARAAANPDVAGAWARMNVLAERWELLHAFCDTLRCNGVVRSFNVEHTGVMFPIDYRYVYPERITDTYPSHSSFPDERAPARVLLDAFRLDAEPGLFTAEQVAQYRADLLAREQAAAAAGHARATAVANTPDPAGDSFHDELSNTDAAHHGSATQAPVVEGVPQHPGEERALTHPMRSSRKPAAATE